MMTKYQCPDCDAKLTSQGLLGHGSAKHGWSRERYNELRETLGLPALHKASDDPPPASPTPSPDPVPAADDKEQEATTSWGTAVLVAAIVVGAAALLAAMKTAPTTA